MKHIQFDTIDVQKADESVDGIKKIAELANKGNTLVILEPEDSDEVVICYSKQKFSKQEARRAFKKLVTEI